MPAADFAAAQRRIAARRAQRALTQNTSSTPSHAQTPTLPFPLNHLTTTCLSTWTAICGRSGTRPSFRVGQVDASLLDAELLSLLSTQVNDALKYHGTHVAASYAAEIQLALSAVLFKLSVWDHDATYGALLQGLRYADARCEGPGGAAPRKWQKGVLALVDVGGRYVWGRWEAWLAQAGEEEEGGYDAQHGGSGRLAFWRRATEVLGTAHDVASLAGFLVFLLNGRYRTLTDRVLRLRLTPSAHATSREVSFEYLNRQLVWHAFTEFLLFLLPLVGIARWRRILSRAVRRVKSTLLTLLGRSSTSTSSSSSTTNNNNGDDDTDPEKKGEFAFLPQRTCAICYSSSTSVDPSNPTSPSTSGGVIGSAATDITNPYEAIPCGCIYCFTCLAQHIAAEEGEGWMCLRCGEVVRECRAWGGDVLPARRKVGDDAEGEGERGKSVIFAQVERSDDGDDAGGDTGEEALRRVDPRAEGDGEDGAVEVSSAALLEKTRGLDLGESLAFTESEAWGRESEEDEDEQSEEYDEDEEVEGEELEELEDYEA